MVPSRRVAQLLLLGTAIETDVATMLTHTCFHQERGLGCGQFWQLFQATLTLRALELNKAVRIELDPLSPSLVKALAILLTSLLLTAWIGAIAILSIQNFSPVSLRFLGFQSVAIPVGLVLAFSVGFGLLGTAIAQPLLGFSSFQRDDEDD